jgi:RNA polymerase sigma-70 factor (ECF subfamily)
MLRSLDRGGLRVPVSARGRSEPSDAEAAWRELRRRLLGFIARRVRDGGAAEDILQEVMLRIHRHAGELESASALGAWVHQIARNAIADHYRSATVRRELPAGVALDRERPPEVDGPELRSELAACLAPLLKRLPEINGLTQARAAPRVGMSTSGMKARVQRARAQLKELLVDCCEIELDRRGGITSYEPRGGACDCRPSRSTPPAQ